MMKLRYLIVFIAIASISLLAYGLFHAIEWPFGRNDASLTLSKSKKDPTQRSSMGKRQRADPDLAASQSDFVYPVQVSVRDPFQQKMTHVVPTSEMDTPSRPILTGVLYNERDPIAIFVDKEGNSYLLRESDVILDSRVKRILRRSVILTRSDKDTEFQVFDESMSPEPRTIAARVQEPPSVNHAEVVEVQRTVKERSYATDTDIEEWGEVARPSWYKSYQMRARKANRKKTQENNGTAIDLVGSPLDSKSRNAMAPGLQERLKVLLDSKS